jgi:hypothetical protein
MCKSGSHTEARGGAAPHAVFSLIKQRLPAVAFVIFGFTSFAISLLDRSG